MPVKIGKLKKKKENNKEINKTINKQINKTKEKNSKNIVILIFILSIILGIVAGISLAKYKETKVVKAFASIAKPILEVRREQSMLITALAPKATYTFEVRNYNEEETTGVELEYYIEIISHTDEAIQFNLYRGEEKIPLTKNKTQMIKLGKDQKYSHTYELEIIYNKEMGIDQKDINDNVEIKIHSIQKA